MRLNEIKTSGILAVLVALVVALGQPISAMAQTVQPGRPMIIFIYSKKCDVCPRVKPVLADLQQQYGDKIEFITLDVTDDALKAEARKRGKELGVGAFVAFCVDAFPTVGVFGPNHRVIKELYGYHPRQAYEELIGRAIKG